jgi:hypothetical protein
LEEFTPEQQKRLAEYVHSLREEPTPLPPAPLVRDLLRNIATLDPESAREMREAIEEEFERIELDSW